MRSPRAEIARKKYALRKSIVEQKLLIPYRAALPLIGPDCAYHLYSQMERRGGIQRGRIQDKQKKR